MSFNQEEIRKKEKETKERLALISMLLFEQLLAEEEAYNLGAYLLEESFNDVLAQINAEATGQGLPAVTAEELKGILDQALADYEKEVSDLRDDPEGTGIRIELTAGWLDWSIFNQGIKRVAESADKGVIEYRTAQDEKVCAICRAAEGIYSIESVPTPPLHPNCRCYLMIPSNQDRLDAARDMLDSTYTRYMAKILAKN